MFHILNRLEVGIIATLLVLTTLLVVIEVVLRFMFGFGFMWLQELTLHIAAWFVLFGASYGVKVGAHIQVDTVVNALSKGPKRIAGVIALTSGLIYCGLVLYGLVLL